MFISLSCKVSWLPALSVLEHLFSLLSLLLIEYGRFNYFFFPHAYCFILNPRFLGYFLRIQTWRIGMAPVVPPCRWDRALESEHMWARCSNQLATFMRMTKELRKVQDGTSQTRGNTPVSFREKCRSRMGIMEPNGPPDWQNHDLIFIIHWLVPFQYVVRERCFSLQSF